MSDPRRGAAHLAIRVVVVIAFAVGSSLSSLSALLVTAAPAGATECGPAPQGSVAVVVVVDRGGGPPSARCVVLTQGATGLDAMRAAGHSVRLDGGFVCGIDGVPATGCGNRADSGQAYWRYWHAPPGGAWSYSQVGAGGYRLPARCAVEGWVWSDAPTSNTPPGVAAPSPMCEAPAPGAPPATAAPASPASPPSTRASQVGPGAPDPGSPVPGAIDGQQGSAGDGVSDVAGSAEVAGATTVAPEPIGGPDAVGDVGAGTGSPDGSGDRARTDARDGTGDEERAAGPISGEVPSPPPWGALAGVVLIGALGGAAVLRSRGRRDPAGPGSS